MRICNITSKGKRFFATALAAFLAFALAFTFNGCGSDSSDGPLPPPPVSSSSSGGSSSSVGNNGGLDGNPQYEYMKEELKYYDPNDGERCENGVVERICKLPSGEVWYNPLAHSCVWISDEIIGSTVTTTYELGTSEICGDRIYGFSPNGSDRCLGGVFQIKDKCEEWFNPETQYCDCDEWDDATNTCIRAIKPQEPCGSSYVDPSWPGNRCEGGVVEHKCGWGDPEKWYNPKTHYCVWITSFVVKIEPCGNLYTGSFLIHDLEERCQNGVLESKCKDTWINPITQSCNENGTVKDKMKCGN